MTKEALLADIVAELTGSGTLPQILKDAEIIRVIEQTKKYFYDRYRYATEDQRLILPSSIFGTQEFKRSRSITLPDNFLSVHKVKEIKSNGRFNFIDKDFSEARMMASSVYIDNSMGDDLVLRVARAQMIDLTKIFIVDDITYSFNKNNKKLQILGRDPKLKVLVEGMVGIEDDKLMEDHYFIRYCHAKAKESFARIIGMYKFPLPGNVEIDVDSLRSESEAELEKIEEYLISSDPMDWFITF